MRNRLFLAATAALALTGVASAMPNVEPRLKWNPPARYAHAYRGQLLVTAVPQPLVVLLCRHFAGAYDMPLGVTHGQKGCAFRGVGWCHVIHISHVFRGIEPADVYRHEIGHCNGWPASHPE